MKPILNSLFQQPNIVSPHGCCSLGSIDAIKSYHVLGLKMDHLPLNLNDLIHSFLWYPSTSTYWTITRPIYSPWWWFYTSSLYMPKPLKKTRCYCHLYNGWVMVVWPTSWFVIGRICNRQRKIKRMYLLSSLELLALEL